MTFEEQALEGSKEKTRRKPCVKNRVAPEVEEEVLNIAYEYPAYGETQALNELRKKGGFVSGGGVRSIWLRHGLETFKKRVVFLEEKAAREGVVYTEAQVGRWRWRRGSGSSIRMRLRRSIRDIC